MSDYPIVPFCGYRVIYPHSRDRAAHRAEVYSLQVVFPEPFCVMNLLPVVAFGDDCTPDEYNRLDRLSELWIGFIPEDIAQVTELLETLTHFLRDNTMVNWLQFDKSGFTAGSEWFDQEDSEVSSQDESDDYDSDEWDEEEEEEEEEVEDDEEEVDEDAEEEQKN